MTEAARQPDQAPSRPDRALAGALAGRRLGKEEALALARVKHLDPLMRAASALRDRGHGAVVSYSRKVFIPLTRLCRDVCHYCTFARPPCAGEAPYLSRDEVLAIARAGTAAGCHEALFTLGDKPERRYRVAREALKELGHDTTISYLAEAAALVQRETGLLPHLNPGVLSEADIDLLRPVSVSLGLMLESTSEHLCGKGGPHYGSPDKHPAARLATLEAAGRRRVPMTTGILIGIGETRAERVDALLAIRDLHDRYGHIQETIIQNFCPKPDTRMADESPADETELLWTVAVARLVLGSEANIQAPPNLSPGRLERLIAAGISDWGGVSPVTPDHVNPERAWPALDALEAATSRAGKVLTARLSIYPAYANAPGRWLDPAQRTAVLEARDTDGYARTDGWRAGVTKAVPQGWQRRSGIGPRGSLDAILRRAERGERLGEGEIVRLFAARGAAAYEVCDAADRLRRAVSGDAVTYVVNRNINYTNICQFQCRFCAFSKGRTTEELRGRPYLLDLEEIGRRTAEAWQRGATEVCLQGGIHPDYTAETYVEICRTVKAAAPEIHVHAFSPLEIWQGARTSGLSVAALLGRLAEVGLGSLPGTAAEILDDAVRRIICPDKIDTATWLEVVETAHRLGLRTTSTIMFGHVDRTVHWARHLLRLRDLQERTGGITEFVPLPFVAAQAPIYLKGQARPGPTFREAVLMHAVARLALHPLISNIQTSWVKMGSEGTLACLAAGANDLGGTLMNESITRAAGALHGQELGAEEMVRLIQSIGRTPRQRTTSYQGVRAERGHAASAEMRRCEVGTVTSMA